MYKITQSTSRVVISAQNRIALRNEAGSAAADYVATALVAVGLVMALFAIVTSGHISGILQTLITKSLTTATNLIKS